MNFIAPVALADQHLALALGADADRLAVRSGMMRASCWLRSLSASKAPSLKIGQFW